MWQPGTGGQILKASNGHNVVDILLHSQEPKPGRTTNGARMSGAMCSPNDISDIVWNRQYEKWAQSTTRLQWEGSMRAVSLTLPSYLLGNTYAMFTHSFRSRKHKNGSTIIKQEGFE